MKKQDKKLIRIICFTLAILFALSLPINSFLETYYNVYASTTVLDKNIIKQGLTALLISGGLVFYSQESTTGVVDELTEYLNSLGDNFELPQKDPDPEKPKITLGEAIAIFASGKVIFDNTKGQFKKIMTAGEDFFQLIKNWIDEKFNPGENFNNHGLINIIGINQYYYFNADNARLYYYNSDLKITYYFKYTESTNRVDFCLSNGYVLSGYPGQNYIHLKNVGNSLQRRPYEDYVGGYEETVSYISYLGDVTEFPQKLDVIGTDIVDNPNYDWNNPITQDKTITLPVKTDTEGKPEVDSDGFHVTEVDSTYWIDKIAEDIIQDDPSGIPEPEEPDPNDEDATQTGILNTLKNFLHYFRKITSDVSDIKENTDAIAEGGGSGTYNPTDIATGFDWGDFRKFFDIIYIFIYFIVILILILVKFLGIVFTQLTSISPNTALFDSYPSILSGVNYLKNLKVGGLSITVHQAFEYVFMIFFFIFIIKQIRKLYGAYVYEENERNRNSKVADYEIIPDSKKLTIDSYENIKITDYTKKDRW